MSEAIIVAIITGGLSLIGVIVSNNRTAQNMDKSMDAKLDKQQAVTETKLEELTREVRAHNNFAQRVPVLEEQIKVANHRIEDLEKERGEEHMETILNTILTPLPAWLALVLIVVGAVSLALGLIRLGYGAAVKTLVLDLIDQAEREIQGTKRGAERKAWCVKMLRTYLNNSRWGKLVSWAITEETMSKVIQFFFDRARSALQKQ